MHDSSLFSPEVRRLIRYLNLSPHPEGGYFCENYRSAGVIDKSGLPDYYNENRSFSTAIYFMLPKGHISHFHKVKTDEVWHFYGGGSLTLIQIFENGRREDVQIGSNVFEGEHLQYVVPANCWFAAFPNDDVEYSLVGCTVSPGFDYKDFELGSKQELADRFPQHAALFDKYSL